MAQTTHRSTNLGVDVTMELSGEVLGAWGWGGAAVEPIAVGHINLTYRVSYAGGVAAVQRLNPIFSPELHHDIQAITTVLSAGGVGTPELIPTTDGALWFTAGDGGVWRALTWIAGNNHDVATGPAMCGSAGGLVARFHRVLGSMSYEFRAQRLGVHDTPAHLRALRQALATNKEHVAYPHVAPIALGVVDGLRELPSLAGLPEHIAHGDLKISNIIFDDQDRAIALIDLDTLARMSIPVELGDALRSWCNPGGEGANDQPAFSLARYRAALEGYAAEIQGGLTPAEVRAIPTAVETISLELTARFAADMLNERYFGWDSERYESAWQHHQVRGISQLEFARSFRAQHADVVRTTESVFGL